jgi:hypothetical protein
MKKMKCMAEGDVIETETTQGENANIGDDTRARAMAAIAAGGVKDEAPAKPKKKKARSKTNAATESHSRMNAMGDTYARGGKVSQLSKANGCAIRGKTRGRIV